MMSQGCDWMILFWKACGMLIWKYVLLDHIVQTWYVRTNTQVKCLTVIFLSVSSPPSLPPSLSPSLSPDFDSEHR